MTFRPTPQLSNPIENLEPRLLMSNVPPVRNASDFSATVLTDTTVLLEWTDTAFNELKFVISRSTDGIEFRDVINTVPGAVSWVDNTVLPETEYFYRIRAVARIGDSAFSPVVNVTTLATDEDPFAQLDMDTGVVEVLGTDADDILSLTVGSGVLGVTLNGEEIDFDKVDVFRISILTYTGNDRISIGSSVGAVNVAGGEGNDSIFSSAGNDRLDGGPGDDSIKGNAGNDTITGGEGNDIIYGQAGDDFIRGNQGNDKLVGGDGNDSMFGDRGNDRLYGELGIDSLLGDGGSNYIRQD